MPEMETKRSQMNTLQLQTIFGIFINFKHDEDIARLPNNNSKNNNNKQYNNDKHLNDQIIRTISENPFISHVNAKQCTKYKIYVYEYLALFLVMQL